MTYFAEIEAAAARAAKVLRKKGIEERFCLFSGDAAQNQGRIWAPSQAMTKFQMEQALGDWAEETIRTAINANGDFKAIAFGDNDKTLSEDASFADQYRSGKVRELEFGKRSDLLLFNADVKTPDDASTLTGQEAEQLCTSCLAGLEVRSSRTSAHRFIAFQEQQLAAGKKPARMEPSFTVKIEDLEKVYRWIARNKKPIAYIQVFFDSIYALNFAYVFELINELDSKLKLEKPSRSAKPTIMIPISNGICIGEVTPPEFTVVHNALASGRHDIYAAPFGGNANIDVTRLMQVL